MMRALPYAITFILISLFMRADDKLGVIIGIVGLGLASWAFITGIGTRELNRAQVFQGPTGTLLNLFAIIIGAIMAINGFW